MNFSTLFFDLDDTLYPNNTGLWEAIRERMALYMSERLGLPQEQVQNLRRTYFQTYGTTLRGLQLHHEVDADDYLAYVHDLPLEEYIRPDPELQKLLAELPQQRFIFTNADADHARRVMNILGVAGYFDGIIDIRAIEFACKPELSAYQHALAVAGDPLPQECVMLDDSITNLLPARKLGFTTVLVHHDHCKDKVVDYSISNIKDLPLVLPDLWDGHLKPHTYCEHAHD
jgi:putative hydrolase of the HAD superfamily